MQGEAKPTTTISLVNRVKLGMLILVVSMLFSCQEESLYEIQISGIDTLNTLLPDSTFLISSQIEAYDDKFYYWDEPLSSLVLLDSSFSWDQKVSIGPGNGPDELSFYLGHSIIDNKVFILGEKCLVFDLEERRFLGKYNVPSCDFSWILKFNGDYVFGGLNGVDLTYDIYTARFDETDGFTSVKKMTEVQFPRGLDELSIFADAKVIGGNLFVFKKEIGELTKLDKSFNVVYDKKLPFSYAPEENFTRYDNGELDYNIIEAWSFTSYKNQIFVLRHNDLANGYSRPMRTVHIFNLDLKPVGYIRLPTEGKDISFIDDYLYSVYSTNESYLRYSISY